MSRFLYKPIMVIVIYKDSSINVTVFIHNIDSVRCHAGTLSSRKQRDEQRRGYFIARSQNVNSTKVLLQFVYLQTVFILTSYQ